jgi:hypothetical protein
MCVLQKEEPALASFLYSTILSHSTMEGCISFLLGNKLANSALLDTQIMMLFRQVNILHCPLSSRAPPTLAGQRRRLQRRGDGCQAGAGCRHIRRHTLGIPVRGW